MKLPGHMATDLEKKEKKKKILITTLCVSLVVLAIVSIVILGIAISKRVKEAELNPTPTSAVKVQTVTEAPKDADGQETPAPAASTPTPTSKATKWNGLGVSTPTPTATPKPTDTPTPTVAPTRGPTVLLDPGHGGNDGGTSGYRDERKDDGSHYWECDIVLSIALKVREKLEAQGITVLMTRDDDFFPGTPTERVVYADGLDIDCLVSIHLNASGDASGGSISGTETWYCESITKDVRERLEEKLPEGEYDAYTAQLLESREKLASFIQNSLIGKTGSRDRYIKPTDDLALVKCIYPSCLVECEFLSADEIFPKLISDEYQDLVAEGITNGIIKYLDWAGVTD